MSDASETQPDAGAPTPPEMDVPDEANEDEFTGDEVTEATPPNAGEGEDAPEAG